MAKKKGAKTKYKPEYDQIAYGACLLGATDKKLASIFCVNEDTINERKKKHPTFKYQLSQGKDIADIEIAKSLFSRAKGMTLKKQAVIKLKVDEYVEEVSVVDYVEEIAPDPISIKFWLTNRTSFWRDKKEIDSTITTESDFVPLPKEQIKNLGDNELSEYLHSLIIKGATQKNKKKT